MTKRLLSLIFLISITLATACWVRLVNDSFARFDINYDLSNETIAEAALGPDWKIVPVPKWPGVVQVYDRGKPATVRFSLPEFSGYRLRLKVNFREPGAWVSYAWNGVFLDQWNASKVGEAEKVRLTVPSTLAKQGPNELTFESGQAGSVLYEQVRIRNFRSEIWPDHLYVIPHQPATQSGFDTILVTNILFLIFGLVLWFGSAWLWAYITGRPLLHWLHWGSISWVITAIGGLALLSVERFSEFQLTMDTLAYTCCFLGLWGIGQLPALLRVCGMLCVHLLTGGKTVGRIFPFLAKEVAQTAQTAADLSVRLKGPLRQALVALGVGCWVLVRSLSTLVVRSLFGLGRWVLKMVFQVLRSLIRWFLSNQHPKGYLKMSAIFFGISLICIPLLLKGLQVGFAHASGIALVLAMVLLGLQGLNEEEPPIP